ncbi:MAG: flagellar filament capping protein FliD, partial [Bacillota bacterium]
YESGADKVSISRTATGNFNTSGEEITVGTTGFLAQVLKIDQALEQGGTDADVTVNGLALKQHSNTFTLNNISFTVKKQGTASVTVSTDVDGIVASVKGFVESYNALIDTINSELKETRYKDYLPLTEDQKEELTDRQIDQWEDKARSGLLQNDRILESALSRLRSAIYGVVTGVSGPYDHLSDIGITTINYASGGKLQIDETKLRAAIEANPDGIKELFTKTGASDAEKGLGERLYDVAKTVLDRLTAEAGSFAASTDYDNSYLGRTLKSMDSQIDRMEKHLQELEDRYWKQFTALEQAISRMNAQSAWLSQQFTDTR